MAKKTDGVSGGAVEQNEAVARLKGIPNVGPRMASALLKLGVASLRVAAGRDPDEMYLELCAIDTKRYDPCARDIFAAVVSHAEGGPASRGGSSPRSGRPVMRWGRKLEGRRRNEVWPCHSLCAGRRAVGRKVGQHFSSRSHYLARYGYEATDQRRWFRPLSSSPRRSLRLSRCLSRMRRWPDG